MFQGKNKILKQIEDLQARLMYVQYTEKVNYFV